MENIPRAGNARKKGKQKEPSRVTGEMLTAILFIIIIYVMFFGMIKNQKSIASTFQKSYQEGEGNILDKTAAGISSAEAVIDKSIVSRQKLIDIFGLFQVALGRKEVEAQSIEKYVYKLDNGQLAFSYPTYSTNWIANQFATLKAACDGQNAEFLYVQWPYKVDKYNNQLPHGKEDLSNKNADNLLAGLKKKKIAALDYREVLHEKYGSGESYSSLFFNTDHHWKTETAFEAYTYLLDYLSKNYGLEYDPKIVKKSNFIFENVEKCFIGSLANNVGTLYGGVDDFTYIYPAFDTDFVWEKYTKELELILTREGSFNETLLFETVMENPDIAKTYRDNCYFNGNPALVKITNKDVEKGKILFVCDSYSKPIVSFLSLAVHHLEFMDLRDFTEIDLVDYIQGQGFDMVIVAYNVSAIKRSTAPFFAFKRTSK